jgi:hypothetical protein
MEKVWARTSKGRSEKRCRHLQSLMQQKKFLCDTQRALEEDKARRDLQRAMQISLEEAHVHK